MKDLYGGVEQLKQAFMSGHAWFMGCGLAVFGIIVLVGVICLQPAVLCPEVANGKGALNTDDSGWYFPSPRIALLGDSILVASGVYYYPESVIGDGKNLKIILPSEKHDINEGTKVKFIGYDREISSEFFTVADVEGNKITINSHFIGTATRQFKVQAALATTQTGHYGYVAQALQRSTGGKPLFTVSVPAMLVSSTSRDSLIRMDYELMPFVDEFDMVLIQLGTNDMSGGGIPIDEYTANMEGIITKLLGADKRVVIANIPPILQSAKNADAYAGRILAANKSLGALAGKYNLPVLDMHAKLANGVFANKVYMRDAQHPDKTGHGALADVLYEYAQKYFTEN